MINWFHYYIKFELKHLYTNKGFFCGKIIESSRCFYKNIHLEVSYDIVIIGSGLGGLLAAVLLAQEGRKVAVVEQNKQIGGCLQTFAFDKKVFDSCVHYFGAMDAGQTQQRIFEYAGIAHDLKLQQLEKDSFDKVLFGSDAEMYPLAQGASNFKAQLLKYFPDAADELDYYLNTVNDVTQRFPLYSLQNGDAGLKQAVLGLSISDVLSKIKNEKLRQVLTGNSLLYAGDANQTPFYIHALVSKSYIDSAYKCDGGSSHISKLLWRRLQNLGGVVFKNEKVIKLEEEDGCITAAITEQGSRFTGKQFIVNVHPAMALNWIESPVIKPIYRKRISEAKNSISAFMMNIVLEPGKVPYPNHNYYWNRTPDSLAAVHYNAADWPANYALYYNEDKAYPGFAETVTILTYMHAEEGSEWASTFNNTLDSNERSGSYQAFKAYKAKVLLSCVAERFPEIKQSVKSFTTASPLTFRDYMGSPDGSIYGIMADAERQEQTQIPCRTKFRNLYLTGQNIGVHGVLGVSINAIAACGELLGLEYLVNKINKSH